MINDFHRLLPWKESGDLQRSLRLADMINDSHAELLPARTVSWKSLFDLKKFQHIAPIISLETFFELVEKSSSENVELWIVNDLERYSYLLAEDIPGI